MLNIVHQSFSINDIREGRIRFDVDMAHHVLEHMNYERQRRIEQPHVDALAASMYHGTWMAGSQIAFARLNGAVHLINGQHRLAAVVKCGIAQEFQVLMVPCQDEQGLRQLYRRFDTGRNRSDEQILAAAGVSDDQGVSKSMAKGVYKAISFILNDMRTPVGSHAANAVERRVFDFRMEAARPFWHAARTFEKAIDKASPIALKRKLLNGAVVAVGLQTCRHQSEQASVFWSRLAANDGLCKGEPQKALYDYLLTANNRGDGDAYMGACAAAWNAFVDGRSLSIIRPQMPIRLRGTLIGEVR